MQLATILLSIMVNFNRIAAMKKFMKSLVLFAAAAMALTSCENEMMNEGIESNETYTMNFVAGEPESRTSVKVDGENVTFAWASEGETFAFAQNTTGGLKLGTDVNFNNNGGLAEITATFTEATSPIVAVYPEAAWVSNNDDYNKVKLIVLKDQDILDGTFDPKADLMVSEEITPENTTDTHSLKFGRVVAVGKMTISNLHVEGAETIKKVNFSISSENALTGRLYIDLAEGIVSEWGYSNNAYKEVTLRGNVAATASNDFYFTCMPATIAAGETFTVEVTTDAATYTRTVTIPDGKSIEFACGKVSTFGVNMATAERVENEGIALPWSEGFDSDVLSNYDVVNGDSDTKFYDENLAKGVAAGEILIGKNGGSMTATIASDGTAKTLNLWFKSNYGGYITVSSATEGVTTNQITNTGYTVALDEGVEVFKLTLTNNDADKNVRVDDIMLTEDAPYIEKLTITGETVLFTEGDDFELGDGFTVTANYINGVNEDVTAYATINSDDVNMATAGTYEVIVSYQGVEATYNVTVQSADIQTATKTLTFDDTKKRTVGTTSQQVWVENGITVTNNKGSGSNVNTSYYNPVRFYQNSEVIVEAPGNITTIEFTASSTTYATALKNSAGSEASANGSVVTIVPASANTTYTIASLTAQVRLNSVTVTYVSSGETPEPEQLVMSAVTCTAQTHNSLTFAWSAVANASGYEVTIDGETETVNDTEYTATGLTAETPYTISVKALGDGTYYTDSAAVEATGTTTANTSGVNEVVATIAPRSVTASGGSYTDDQGNTWVLTSDAAGFTSNNSYVHAGSGSKKVSHITMSSTITNVKTVTVTAASAKNSNVTIKVYIDDTLIGESAILSNTQTSGGTEFTVSNTSNVEGALKVVVSRPTSTTGAIYFMQAEVTYEN